MHVISAFLIAVLSHTKRPRLVTAAKMPGATKSVSYRCVARCVNIRKERIAREDAVTLHRMVRTSLPCFEYFSSRRPDGTKSAPASIGATHNAPTVGSMKYSGGNGCLSAESNGNRKTIRIQGNTGLISGRERSMK